MLPLPRGLLTHFTHRAQITHEVNGKKSHTSYLITTDVLLPLHVLALPSRRVVLTLRAWGAACVPAHKTSFPEYKDTHLQVRRRYSDFVWLRNHLKKKMEESPKGKKKGGTIPNLPGDSFVSLFGPGRFEDDFIEERRKGLEIFINSVSNHVICRFEEALHTFLQDPSEDRFKQFA